MLPNSTERAITIAGTPQSIIECVKQICVVMLEVQMPTHVKLMLSTVNASSKSKDVSALSVSTKRSHHPLQAQTLRLSGHLRRWSGKQNALMMISWKFTG